MTDTFETTATAAPDSAAAEKKLVYLVLGTSGSGRREIVRELMGSAFADEACALLVSDSEAAEARSPDASGAAQRRVAEATWCWEEASASERSAAAGAVAGQIGAEWPQGAAIVFLIADGRRSPVDQVEALKPWLAQHGAELGRIFCVVNCQFAATHPEALPWFDACVHFSDVVLLNGREGIPNKWVSDFQKRYTEQRYPCLFELVKKSRVDNPLVIVEPQARRISQYFDEAEALQIEGLVIETDSGEVDDDEADTDDVLPEDPYLARRVGGRRAREVPSIASAT